MVADQPLDPMGEGGLVAGELIGAVGGERKGHLVRAGLDAMMVMVVGGLGGVGHWVDEPDRGPEVVADEGLGDDVAGALPARQLLQGLGGGGVVGDAAAMSSLSPP